MPRDAFAFWRFSLRTYRQPAVAKACLALQDECGADVNVLLYCCWLGSERKQLDQRAMQRTITAVRRWHDEVVRPLRHARKAIRKDQRGTAAEPALALRRKIAAAELDAEYVEQRILAAVAATTSVRIGSGPPRETAAANLARYLRALGAPTDQRSSRQVRTLADSAGGRAARLDRTTR